MKMENNTMWGRNIKIDIIKGISILFVLWGHSIQYLTQNEAYYGDLIFRFIYSFHMPLFALISGYLFYSSQLKRNFREVLHSKVISLLIPIAVWTSLDWMFGILLHKNFSINEWIATFTGNMLWFLWSVLAANIVLVIAEKKIKLQYIKVGWLFIGFFLMYFFPNAELNLYLYPYIILGFYYKKHKDILKNKIKAWIWIVLFILLLPFYNENMFIYTSGISFWKSNMAIQNHLFVDLYRYIIGLSGSITVIYIVCVIEGKLKNVDKVLAIAGRYTMQIYIMQCFFFKLFGRMLRTFTGRFLKEILTQKIICRDMIIALLLSWGVFVVCLSFGKVIEKNKKLSTVLFGR